MAHILVIGGRDFTMRCYPEMDLKFTLIQTPDHLTDYQKSIAHNLIEFDFNAASPVELAKQLHAEDPFTVVISITEFALQSAADISEALGIPTNCNPIATKVTRNKLLLRECLQKAGLNTVPFSKINTLEDLSNFLHQHGKVIIKPTHGAGSFGVQLVENISQAEAAIKHAKQVSMGEVFAEGFIFGQEYSIESMSKNGQHEVVAITEKLTTGAPHFVETGHTQPAPLNTQTHQKISAVVIGMLDAIHHETGPCHSEVKVDNGKVQIIETQNRSGGDNIWLLTRLTTGTDFFKETVATLLNLPQPIRKPKAYASAIRYLIPKVDFVNDIKFAQDIASEPGVIEFQVDIKSGQKLGAVDSSRRRAGHAMTIGDSQDQAISRAEKALEKIEIS